MSWGVAFGLAGLLLVLAAAGGCTGSSGDESGARAPSPTTYAEARKRIAELIDATVDATLAGFPIKETPFSGSTPCRSAGGSGPATGEYAPGGGLEIRLDEGTDVTELVRSVERYWKSRGYGVRATGLEGPLPTVYAQMGSEEDGYTMSLEVMKKSNVATLDGSGPCREPANEAERDSPPDFRSVRRRAR